MPRIVCRVVCGRLEVIATLVPTRALVNVDLPVLGRPMKHTNPERNSLTADLSRRNCGEIAIWAGTAICAQSRLSYGVARAIGDDHGRICGQLAHCGQAGVV